ncbi:HupE/UreJ family protein [Pelagibacterium sp.]|uniref:HupE/UreJ family protein n=1 Tax=Pelagibacterium sp. TaxID=1967288 RepID=UPI003A909174
MVKRLISALMLITVSTAPAYAHLDPVEHGAFAAGFTHPLFGLDHILAMLAVGLWAASVGGKALWAVPGAFVATMALGFGAALVGVPLPFVEPVILASVIFIGIMVALALPLPTAGIAAVVGFFALFHGHAHGGEMGQADTFGYSAGFLVATALLNAVGVAAGIGLDRILATQRGAFAKRIAGGLAALGGVWLVIAG